jgi:hypothetical protein
MHEQYSTCIEACNECAIDCEHCAVACLEEPNVSTLGRCIRLDLDCASICRVAAELMSRGSEAAVDVCRLTAQICRMCAEECRKHSMDHCRRCAEACERCAAECERMAGGSEGRRAAVG